MSSTIEPGTDLIKVSNFTYSLTKINDLEASEYTLVGICSDVSGSVKDYKTEMETVLKSAILACRKSPRADNLLIRHTTFADRVSTNHDWKMLKYINPEDYDDSLKLGGYTSLHDAAIEMLTVMEDTGRKLVDARFAVNGALYFITDGDNNWGISTTAMIKALKEKIEREESLESLVVIVIAVNPSKNPNISDKLKAFYKESNFTQYIEIEDVTEKTIARLSNFISQSVSSQSNALGSGGPSKQITSGSLTI